MIQRKEVSSVTSSQLCQHICLRPKNLVSEPLQRAMDLAQERGASSWLTSLSLEEFNFSLHKGAFRDAIALRYGWLPSNLSTNCPCGSSFSVQHALSCPTGGFPTLCHNEVRDLTANLMAEVCHDVCTEPSLQPITGETLTGASAITDDGARLDIAASGFWGGHHNPFFDVNPYNMLPQIDNLSLPVTENTRTSKGRSTNSVSGKLNMGHSHP